MSISIVAVFVFCIGLQANEAKELLYALPSPDEFMWDASVVPSFTGHPDREELTRTNNCLRAFSSCLELDQRAALTSFVEESREKLPGFVREDFDGRFDDVPRLDCAKLDFIALAKGFKPRLASVSHFKKGSVWPSIDFGPDFKPYPPMGKVQLNG